MKTVHMCSADAFCIDCKESGGEYGVPEVYYCMAAHCTSPGKDCEYIRHGGKRPAED